MVEILGRQIEVGLAVEATRGTLESTPDRWGRKVVANIVHRAQRVKDDATRGRLEDGEASRLVQQWIDGELQGIVHVDLLGYLLYSLYGAVSSDLVAGSSTVYDHVFTLDQVATHPTLTIFAKDGSVAQHRFGGALVNTLELSATVDEYLRFTANIVAKSVGSDASTPSYSTEYDFIGRDITIKAADTEGGISGATALKVKNATIRWDQGVIRNHVFGSRFPDANYNSKMVIEVEITRDYIDTTFRDLFHGDSAKYVQVAIVGEANLDVGSRKPSITLLLNKAQVTAWDRTGGSDELVQETFTLTGFYNATDSQQSDITLRNLTEAYAVGS